MAIVFGASFLAGCLGASTAAPVPKQRAAPGPVRILALGDSYTIGEGVRGRERWPLQLAAALQRGDVAIAQPQIIAGTGWTTRDLLDAIEAVKPAGPFDLVTVLIGVNDQYRGRALDEYRESLTALLAKATALAGCDPSRVLVLSIPDWSVTPFAAGRDRERIATEIDRFNDACREAAARAGVGYVDITPASRSAAADPAQLAGDGLHPSRAMYARWVELARPEVERALSAGRGSRC